MPLKPSSISRCLAFSASLATVRELLQLAAERKLLVISDEVYGELCFRDPPTSASVIAEALGLPMVTLESLSKTHLVPGWRVGWMRFTHAEKMPDLISAIQRLADGRLCSPTPAQYAVRPALEGDQPHIKEFVNEIKKRRDFAMNQIRATSRLSCVEPAAAFYMMIKAKDSGYESDEQFVLDLLAKTGVLVVHGSGFGADARAGYFRLVYLASEGTLASAFNAIKQFLARQSPSAKET